MTDPWRLRCPEEHTTVTPRHTLGVWYCNTCNERYESVTDAKTGEVYVR